MASGSAVTSFAEPVTVVKGLSVKIVLVSGRSCERSVLCERYILSIRLVIVPLMVATLRVSH
jgi:hypothetical protein